MLKPVHPLLTQNTKRRTGSKCTRGYASFGDRESPTHHKNQQTESEQYHDPREWYNLAPLTGKPVLLALNGGRTARAWAERSDDEMRVAAMSALQQFIDAGW